MNGDETKTPITFKPGELYSEVLIHDLCISNWELISEYLPEVSFVISYQKQLKIIQK